MLYCTNFFNTIYVNKEYVVVDTDDLVAESITGEYLIELTKLGYISNVDIVTRDRQHVLCHPEEIYAKGVTNLSYDVTILWLDTIFGVYYNEMVYWIDDKDLLQELDLGT